MESWKDVAQVYEIYEKICEKQGKILYKTIQARLRDSETSQQLSLSGYHLNSCQLNVIVDTIKLNAGYLNTLTTIDLSSNMLNDDVLFGLIDLFERLANLKALNLAQNQLTVKSLKYMHQVLNKTNKTLVCLAIIFFFVFNWQILNERLLFFSSNIKLPIQGS